MKKIHRAIRPDVKNPLLHYLYHIAYTGEGLNIDVTDMSIHILDENNVVGVNIMPANAINNPNTKLCAATILVVDGVTDIINEEEIEGLSNEEEI